MGLEAETMEDRPLVVPPPPPPVRPPARPRGRRWIWLCLLGVLCVSAYGANRHYPQWRGSLNLFATTSAPTSRPAPSVPVIVAHAWRGDLPIYLDGLGTVAAYNVVTIRTRVDGQLVKVAFTEGQMVHEGDLLAEIDPRPFQVQLDQAKGQLAKDEASLKNARQDVQRYQAIDKRAVADRDRDTAIAAVGQFEGAVKADQAQIDAANLQLTYCHIVAPLSGRIGLRMVDQGNLVHASDPNGLAVITQLQPIAVMFSLNEDYLPQILKAQRQDHPLVVEAYDRNADQGMLLATGTLEAIDNQIDQATATARFKARFENREHMLFPNQFVNVRLLVETKKDVVLVPSAAVQLSPQGSFVYVVKPDNTVEMRPVSTGPDEHDVTMIESGVEPGETVVTDGVDKLQPGSKVDAHPAVPTAQKITSRPTTATAPESTTAPADTGFPASAPAHSPETPARFNKRSAAHAQESR